GFHKVAFRVDSRSILALILAAETPTHQHVGDISTLRHLIHRDWEVTTTHTYREGNHAADYLTKWDAFFPREFT
ncbi:hypothetical protein LINPERHAP1_LOCUS25828, partial [Linum perenne]